MKDFKENAIAFLGVIVLIAVLGFGIWSHVAGPCWLWSCAPAKDIPGRCVMK